MKKQGLLLLMLVSTCLMNAQAPEYDQVFFDNSVMPGGYFHSSVQYSGNSYVENIEHRLIVSDAVFFTAKNSLKLNYTSAPQGTWSATIKYPDWRGKDLVKESNFLSFKILLDSNTTLTDLPSIEIATDSGPRVVDSYTANALSNAAGENKILQADTSDALSLVSYLQKDPQNAWCTVRIPLADFKNIHYGLSINIRNIIFKQAQSDGKDHCIYLDQVEFIPTQLNSSNATTPSIEVKGYERHVDITWNKKGLENVKYVQIYRAAPNEAFQAVGIQDPTVGKYSDYMGFHPNNYQYKITLLDYNYNESTPSNIASTSTHPMSDEELVTMVQHAAFDYFWNGAEENSGLSLENSSGRKHMIAMGASGFGIMSLVAGTHEGFITRAQSVERFKKIVSFLSKAEKFHGAFPHFMDGETGKVIPYFGNKDNGADFVETSFLYQGLLVARQFFDQNTPDEKYIRNTITKLWEGVEWNKQTPDNSPYILWHWSPDQGFVIHHTLIGWNETMITYLLAIASPTHGVPASMYYSGWASQSQWAQDYRSGWGGTKEGSMYTNGHTYFGVPLEVGVSSGGPIFFTHFSYMGFDPHGMHDKFMQKDDYFTNFKHIALINYRYCVENPKNNKGYGPNAWGLTASDGPWGYGACEPTLRGDLGTLSPAGAIASMPYLPKQSIAALKNYYRNYGSFLWGEYGFKDAFNLNENWCGGFYMGLSQGSEVVMIQNYKDGYIWKLFMQDPDVKAMVKKVFTTKK